MTKAAKENPDVLVALFRLLAEAPWFDSERGAILKTCRAHQASDIYMGYLKRGSAPFLAWDGWQRAVRR